ncbi:MAG TPA: VWA domain-containing protein [Candidatus Cloacimonetes bacterium]|nr:VWA domain-containing protein [Candidatus Cloacimonadota bacterium]HEX38279.1 VWA domain-containing protein [Candidatus Cloacimonadota bacterium]
MRFGNPEFLLFLLLVPVVIVLMYFSSKRRKKLLAEFSCPELQKKLISNISITSRSLKNILWIVIIIFVILAAARPQWGKKLQILEEKGLDIVVAIDVSRSMLAEDLSPNRIQRAKNSFMTFLDMLTGDRVGLILFSGNAFVQCPITSDYSALKMFASIIDVGLIPEGGTNIAKAIDKALTLYTEDTKNRVMILITDGENLQGNFQDAVKKAKENNIIIYTLGIGTQRGAPIPILNPQTGEKEYLKDKDGNIILTKLDFSNLSWIAKETGGLFFQVATGQQEIQEILNDISLLEKEKIAERRYSQYKEKYAYFAFFALLLLVIEFILWERRIKV